MTTCYVGVDVASVRPEVALQEHLQRTQTVCVTGICMLWLGLRGYSTNARVPHVVHVQHDNIYNGYSDMKTNVELRSLSERDKTGILPKQILIRQTPCLI